MTFVDLQAFLMYPAALQILSSFLKLSGMQLVAMAI